jgi:hypothetical protein
MRRAGWIALLLAVMAGCANTSSSVDSTSETKAGSLFWGVLKEIVDHNVEYRNTGEN